MSDWIKHDGGACPVSNETLVDVRWNNDAEEEASSNTYNVPGGLRAAVVGGWDRVTHYRVIQPTSETQAHMMSVPDMGRNHVRGGPWVEAFGLVSTLCPTMEIDVQDPVGMARKIVDEVKAKDAEIARLRDQLQNVETWAHAFSEMAGKAEWDLAAAEEELEKLRKANDAPNVGVGHNVRGGLLNRLDDHALDHRLGIAQPEGEPCEPRPTGARWRAMV